jgi:hypothetical protein
MTQYFFFENKIDRLSVEILLLAPVQCVLQAYANVVFHTANLAAERGAAFVEYGSGLLLKRVVVRK